MKKILLILFTLLNLCSYAQTKVIEFFLADDWGYQRGRIHRSLCVLNGNSGKFQFVHYGDNDKCMYDAYSYSDGSTIKLSNPSKDYYPDDAVINLSTSGNYYSTAFGKTEIRKINIIPQSNWKSKIAEYDMTSACQYMSNSNSYSSSSSSDGSEIGAAVAGAVIVGAIAGALSSSSSSSGSKQSGPEPGIRSYKNVEIIDVKYTNGTHFMYASATLKVRNMNSYAVVVRLQCRYCSYEWENGRYIKEITIPAREIRTVEITGIQNVDFYDARILSVQ